MTNKPIDIIRQQFHSENMQSELKKSLPAHVTVEKFTRVAMTAIQQNPDLLDANRQSLFGACVQAAQLGLLTDGMLGQAYLVPFKGKVTLIPGYKGLLRLVRQSGDISSVDVDVICENDEVIYTLGDEPKLEVKPTFGKRGDIIGAFAVATFKDGGKQRAVMTKDEIEAVRNQAMSKNSPAWRNNYGEMAKKTVFRRLCKMLPLSVDAEEAVSMEDHADAGIAIDHEPKAKAKKAAPKKGQKRLEALEQAATEPKPDEDGVIDVEAEDESPPVDDDNDGYYYADEDDLV